MCVSGLGPTQIAKKLKATEIMTPTEYWNSIGRNCGKPPVRPFNWCASTVADILSKQEYIGNTVNFRTTRKSFKNIICQIKRDKTFHLRNSKKLLMVFGNLVIF
ncbi:recombinase family protein [Enterococcus faecium]|uniref:recombinase family protein n=1 Tax=Enterococcus faecium TaxID=1352 RepID=UPI001E33AAA8|nr:recombinase family protein [Enterococcus faecium]